VITEWVGSGSEVLGDESSADSSGILRRRLILPYKFPKWPKLKLYLARESF
jgi:hypothetical protein